MAKRRVKPPGMERWTWREIDSGDKMGRGERRAAHRWDEVSKSGPGMQALYVALLVVGVIIAIVSASGKKW